MLHPRLLALAIPLIAALALRAEDNEPNNYSYQPIEITGQKVVTWKDSIAGEQPLPHLEFLKNGSTVVAGGPAVLNGPTANFTPQYGWELREFTVNGNTTSVDQIRISNAGNGRGWATVRVTRKQEVYVSQTDTTTTTVLSTDYFTVYVGRGSAAPAVIAANLDPTFARTDPDPMTGHYTQTDTRFEVEVDASTPNPAFDERDRFQIFWLPVGANFSLTVSSQSFRPKVTTFDAFEFPLDEATAASVTDPVSGAPLPGGSAVIDGQVPTGGAVLLQVTSDDGDSAGIYTFTFTLLDAVSPSVTSSLGIPVDAVRVWSDPLIGSANGTSNVIVGGATYITGTTTVSSPVSFDRLYLGSSVVASGAGGGIISSGGGGQIVAPGAGGGIVASGAGGGIVASGAGSGIVASGAGGGLVANAGIVASGAGGGIVAAGAGITSPLLNAYGIVAAGAGIVASGAGGGIVASGAGGGIIAPGAGGGFVIISGIVASGAGGGIVGAGAGGGIVTPGAGAGIVTPGAGAGLTSMIDVQRATLTTNASPITIPAGPTIETGDSGAMTGVGGLLQGIGSIFSSLVFQGAGASLVNPSSPPVPSGWFGIFGFGFSPGGLTVHGDVALLAGTQHEVEIAGRVPGAKYDFCEIKETLAGNGGHFILHGGPTLVIKLLDGFTPLPADTFTIVAAHFPVVGSYGNAVSGTRVSTHNNSGSFLISYSGTNVILSDYQPNAGSTYQLWAAANFTPTELANALISGPTADPDGDGRANLLEYAQSTPPTIADIAAQPSLVRAANDMQFQFTRDTFPTDLVYHCETSTDLTTWKPEPASFISSASFIESWRAIQRVSGGNKFFRVRLFKP
ncbi:MAG: hypothetical protein K1X78_27255 [Verrucomicrobiaceae bacterium]|nr:hypothetical protein [Verrucomicrobiaceae bacterium]